MNTNIGTSLPIEFLDFKKIEPRELVVFDTKYLDQVPLLNDYIILNKGKWIDVTTVRIGSNGLASRKVLSGYISSVESNGFTLCTKEDFSIKYDEPIYLQVMFDNVLGVVPLHPDYSNINPFKIDSENFYPYFSKLIEMKNLLKECLNGKVHTATLYFRNGSNQKPKNDSKEVVDEPVVFTVVECEILEVNISNIKCKYFKQYTYAKEDVGSYRNVTVSPGTEFIHRLVTHNSYLQKVQVSWEKTNPELLNDQ